MWNAGRPKQELDRLADLRPAVHDVADGDQHVAARGRTRSCRSRSCSSSKQPWTSPTMRCRRPPRSAVRSHDRHAVRRRAEDDQLVRLAARRHLEVAEVQADGACSASSGSRVGWSVRAGSGADTRAVGVEPDDAGAVAVLPGRVEVALALVLGGVDAVDDDARLAAGQGLLEDGGVALPAPARPARCGGSRAGARGSRWSCPNPAGRRARRAVCPRRLLDGYDTACASVLTVTRRVSEGAALADASGYGQDSTRFRMKGRRPGGVKSRCNRAGRSYNRADAPPLLPGSVP